MFVSEAVPRKIDTVPSLGVEAEEVVAAVIEQLKAHRTGISELPTDDLTVDLATLLENLAVSIAVGNDDPFLQHARWLGAGYSARRLPARLIKDELLELKQFLNKQLKNTSAHAVDRLIDSAVQDLERPPQESEESREEPLVTLTGDLLLSALLRGDRERALAVVDGGIRSGLKVLDTYVGVIQPVMRKIGDMWQSGRISVSEEHVATALIQSVMAHCRSHFMGHQKSRGRLALTGVQGELHEVGIQVVGDVAEADGWTIHYLGTNAPSDDTVRYLKKIEPDAIGVSVTMAYNLAAATQLVERIRSEPRLRPATLFAGGQAAAFNSTAWERLGVIWAEDLDADRFISLARQRKNQEMP